MTNSRRIKFVLVGDCGVGKTAMVQRFIDDVYTASSAPTQGFDFYRKAIQLSGIILHYYSRTDGSDQSATVDVWDLSGKALDGPMLEHYLDSAHFVALVYDVTKPATLDRLHSWLETLHKVLRHQPRFILIGTKSMVIM